MQCLCGPISDIHTCTTVYNIGLLNFSFNVLQRHHFIQEAQLMPTNPRDAFRVQSRSPNIAPFYMLGIVSSCAIVTLSLRCTDFTTLDFKKGRDLEIHVRRHSRSLKVVPFDRLRMISY